MEIWSESYLQSQLEEAERYFVNQVDYIFFRFSIPISAGVSCYSLPSFVRKIVRIGYQGYRVEPISYHQMMELCPSSAVVNEGTKNEAPQSRPLYYCLDPKNRWGIKFYPTPPLDIAANDYNIYGSGADNRVVISCWRAPLPGTTSLVLPDYIGRRTRKYYVLSKAFEKEGKGQNIKAAQYHGKKLDFAVEMFKKINSGVFVSKRPRLDESSLLVGRKPHRPVLPPDYPRS